MVAALGETTSMLPPFALVSLRDKMLRDKTGRRILKDKPVINSSTVDIVALRRLPDGLFGREYARFLDDQKVSPDTRVKVSSFLLDYSPDSVCRKSYLLCL